MTRTTYTVSYTVSLHSCTDIADCIMYLQYPPPQWFTGNLNNLIVTAIKKALPGLLDDLITKQGNTFLQNLVLSQTIDKYVKTTDIIHSTIKKSYRYSRTSAGLKCVARSLLQYKTPSFVVNLFLFSFLFSPAGTRR